MSERAGILIVEDDAALRRQVRWALESDYAVLEAGSVDEALERFAEGRPGVVTLDLGLPPKPASAEEGFRALERLLELDPRVKVIVITGNEDRANAVKAIDLGAYDFFSKPVDVDELRVMIGRALHVRALEQEGAERRKAEPAEDRFGEIVGRSRKMRDLFAVIERVAGTTASVLVSGESGTGKELVARELHRRSDRAEGPFIPINCGAIPEALLESELFGHEKGAFTGAHVQRQGRVELAQGGTLFLDEISELPPSLQVKLLRFLQEREIERVGGRERIPIDTRTIAASNLEPQAAIAAGKLREDLFYRLSVVAIALPPLRERGDDIMLLATAFLHRFEREHGRGPKRFSQDAVKALSGYRWPGNVREMENRVRRAVIMAAGAAIGPADLELGPAAAAGSPLRQEQERVERDLIAAALGQAAWNVTRAARALGISRPTLYDRMRKYGLTADPGGRAAGGG